MEHLHIERDGQIAIVTLNRPARRHAVDADLAQALFDAFSDIDVDDSVSVAILTGAGGTFCAGADLKAIEQGRGNRVEVDGHAPLGPTRLRMSKPVIAAVEGHAVAGGLELALWCDLRVAARSAVFGVFCRRWGVPLVDGGTVRLARLIGQSRAMDMVLTGRAVDAEEALAWGLANRVVDDGRALAAARALALQLAGFPQACLRSDRLGVLEAFDRPLDDALRVELLRGRDVLAQAADGVAAFVAGRGRGGAF